MVLHQCSPGNSFVNTHINVVNQIFSLGILLEATKKLKPLDKADSATSDSVEHAVLIYMLKIL